MEPVDLHRELDRLKEVEETFHALFHQSPIGIAYHRVVCDDEGTPIDYFFLDANEHYLDLTGVDPRGKMVTEAFPGIEKDPFDWIGTFGKVALGGESIRFQQYLEPVDRWYDAVGYQSSPGHFVAAFHEITELKRKESELETYRNHLEDLVAERTEQLRIAKEDAERANRSKSIFLANMSHELRTPLNAVLGYAEILAGRESDPRNQHYLKAIRSSGTTLLGLINDILDLARIEAGKLEIDSRPVSLRDVVADVQAMFNGKASEKDLNLVATVSDDLPEFVQLDPVRIRQIITNLLGNAIKFTTDGTVSIACSTDTENGSRSSSGTVGIRIDVEDTGKGIAPEDRERIFETFVQSSGQRTSDFDGTGLGLSIIRNIVSTMGGTIELSSTVGKGSLFRVRFPAVPVVTDRSGVHMPRNSEMEEFRFVGSTVVIVDDIEYNRDLIAAFLAPTGIATIEAADGEEAVHAVVTHKPDLVLMDYKLPRLSGYEATRRLKDDPETAGIPVVIVTASALASDEELLRTVADGFLRKPVTRTQVIREMIRHIPYQTGHGLAVAPMGTIDTIPSVETLRELRELALDGDFRKLNTRLQAITAEDSSLSPFVESLLEYASQYADEEVIAFLEQYLDG